MTIEQEMVEATITGTALIEGMSKQEVEILRIIDEEEIYDITTEPQPFVYLARAELVKKIAATLQKQLLGQAGKDEITGFSGTIIRESNWIDGTTTVEIQPHGLNDGGLPTPTCQFDLNRVSVSPPKKVTIGFTQPVEITPCQ